MSATEESSHWTEDSSGWTEVRPTNRHERLSEVRERVIREGLQIFESSEVTFGRKIAEGGQGTIYEATWHTGTSSKPLSVVVKKFRPLKGISQGHCPPQFWALNVINVCKPLGVFFDHDDSLCMFMPRYSTDLRTLIDSQVRLHGAPFSEQVAVSIIIKLAMSLKVLHEYGIYHRDIKSANILVDTHPNIPFPEVFIADFEMSANVLGTGFWRAPEILQTLDMFSEDMPPLSGKQLQAADVYSFGMTCYEILTGRTPFDDHRWSDYNLVLSGGRPELPDHVSEPLKKFIRRCWHQNPDARPSFAEIIALLQESNIWARDIVPLLQMAVMQGEASMKWLDASPEACLVELKQSVITPEELHTVGFDILPVSAELQRLIAEFISTSEEFVSKFGWDSHVRHPSLPFVESVERRRLITLLQHQLKLHNDDMHAMGDEILNHFYRILESSHVDFFPNSSASLKFSNRMNLVRRMLTSILEGAAESKLSESELTYPDKFAIVRAFINSLLDAGVTRKITFEAVVGIDDQLHVLEGASYGYVRNEFLVKWYCMTAFYPFYDTVTEFLDAVYSRVFSYKTILLYLGYKISAVSGLSDLLFGYTRYSISGFYEVLLSYLALRVNAFSPFFRFYIIWKFWGWKGFLSCLIHIIFRVWA